MNCYILANLQAMEPVKVIITAGQSNTEGRVFNTELPEYMARLADTGYKHCKWIKGFTTDSITGEFAPFWPLCNASNDPRRWAYGAVTYYWMEQALQEDFYVMKWSLGATAIDTLATSSGGYYWQADSLWLFRTSSTAIGGNSLLLSFEELISAGIDNTLSKLDREYEIVAFLWHQGEGDRRRGEYYYENLRKVVAHVRNFLAEKTGKEHYRELPFIYGTISHASKEYNDQVEEAIYRLAAGQTNFYLIDMSQVELRSDQTHFSNVSSEYLGIAMYNTLVDLGATGTRAQKLDPKKWVPAYFKNRQNK
ncbi:MAG: sialate O-acetylesterase [Bacteroides sp.]|nr:sialate O-acetylesterase [Bacteroides sp.]